jgi:hypothetical protein
MKCPISETYTIALAEDGKINQYCTNCKTTHSSQIVPATGEEQIKELKNAPVPKIEFQRSSDPRVCHSAPGSTQNIEEICR